MPSDGALGEPDNPFAKSERPEAAFENPYAVRQFSSPGSAPPDDEEATEKPLRPFRTIWTRPRQTIRQIVAADPDLHVVLLACLVGIGKAFDRASQRNAGDTLSMATIIAVACLLGPLGGMFSLWLTSHLVRLSGAWIGGAGVHHHIRAAIAWGWAPAAFAAPFWIPQIALFGSDMFTEETPRIDAQPMLLIPFFAILCVQLVLSGWSIALLCNTIAETQGFRSAWLGLVNLILAGLLLIVPLVVVVIGVIALTQA